ncbi:ATP-grasp domain-containing protein [Cohnella cellulosilytica]|uniref:ATP-grasp domain-containing protein n=1 Tax=Cohnella cellulosilytica TaxID=986710 RepID=A0ABW2FDK5_9BACL
MTTEASGPLRVLLTGGRSPAALELARLLHAAGHRVYAAESAPYHLCRVSRAVERSFLVPSPAEGAEAFAAALCAIAGECRIDVLIPTCEEIFHISRKLERFRGTCRVLAAPLAELDSLHHKGKFIETAARTGLPVPDTVAVTAPDGWQELLRDPRFAEGLALKPAYSRFASRTLLLDLRRAPPSAARREEISGLLASAGVSDRRPWVAQQLLRGEEWCTYSVAHEGRIAAHAAYRSRFRAGRGASVHYEPAEQPQLFDWVRRFVAAIGFTGQIAFDFMVSPEGAVLPMECNPRATSGVHLFGPEGRLAEALLAPASLLASGRIAAPAPEAGRRGTMLTAAMLSYGLAQAVRERTLGQWLRAWRSSRDVVFRREDPKPCAEQFRLLAWTRKTAARRGLTLQEASTSDIEWNGER